MEIKNVTKLFNDKVIFKDYSASIPENKITFIMGESGSGKTVCLMLAASIFADPCNYKYIADCRQTNVSMELRASFYNNLPLMLDDSATVKEKYGCKACT